MQPHPERHALIIAGILSAAFVSARLIGGSTTPHKLEFHVYLGGWKCNESR
jgi:hypothetical protein